MKFDRRITNGLAMAGVALVIGIPVADVVSAQFMGGPASPEPAAQIAVVDTIAPVPAPLSQRPAAEPADVEVAVAAPAKPVVAAPVATPSQPAATQTAGAVDRYLNSGKPLPSYIADEPGSAPSQVAATPTVRTPIITTPVAAAPVATPAPVDPVQVASIPVEKVAPVPMPLSMRPRPVAAAAPVVVLPGNEPLVIRTGPSVPPPSVTAEDLADWESGPLSEFLAARARQQQQPQPQFDPDYQEGGFFLDELNAPQRRDRFIGPFAN